MGTRKAVNAFYRRIAQRSELILTFGPMSANQAEWGKTTKSTHSAFVVVLATAVRSLQYDCSLAPTQPKLLLKVR